VASKWRGVAIENSESISNVEKAVWRENKRKHDDIKQRAAAIA